MSTVNARTGEVQPVDPAKDWPAVRDRAESLTLQRPEDPAQVAEVMFQTELMLSEIADLLLAVNNDRYEAERAYSKRRNLGIDKYAPGRLVTVAKALAELDAEPERKAWDFQRALFHHIEDVQKALQTKHYGLMNINKNMQSVMFERGRRQ